MATREYKHSVIEKERPDLFDQLAPLIGPTPEEVVGSPVGMNRLAKGMAAMPPQKSRAPPSQIVFSDVD